MPKQTKEYTAWCNMMQGCTNPNNPHYWRYGGSGIVPCNRWYRFENFLDDMGPAPKGFWLTRKDLKKGFSLENCLWAHPTSVYNRNPDNANGKQKVKGVHMSGKRLHARGMYKGVKTLLYSGRSFNDAVAARRKWESEISSLLQSED